MRRQPDEGDSAAERPTSARRRSWLQFAVLTTAFCWPFAAHAHTMQAEEGFISGLTHPVFGLDHFLAMLSVGVVSAQLGGRRIFTVPSAFVLGMIFGGVLGIRGVPWPFTEIGIALSVVILGGAVVFVRQTSNAVAILLVTAGFGSLHGHAHGLEIPRAADPVFYAGGFIFSTSAIHILGVLIGHFMMKRPQSVRWLRYMGACISIVGLVILIRIA